MHEPVLKFSNNEALQSRLDYPDCEDFTLQLKQAISVKYLKSKPFLNSVVCLPAMCKMMLTTVCL